MGIFNLVNCVNETFCSSFIRNTDDSIFDNMSDFNESTAILLSIQNSYQEI